MNANSVLISRDSGTIELLTEPNADTYSEWIPQEGADICLIREQETNRVVGVKLPTKFNAVTVDIV